MTLTVANVKGGCGKSTTAAALLQAAVHAGKRCLAADLDAQGNLSLFLSADTDRAGSYELLHDPDADAIQTTDQDIDVIAAAPDLASETTRPGSSTRLKKAIAPIKDNYDLIVIDTPPSMNELMFNALMAADGLLIPLEADSASLQGFYSMLDIAHEVQKANKTLDVLGVVITRFDGRPKLHRYMQGVIRDTGADLEAPLLATIRQAVAVKEAQAMQLSLYEYAPRCKAAADYMDLLKAIMKEG